MVGDAARDAVSWLNALSTDEAQDELLACCASRRWAVTVAAGRPYGTWSEFLGTAAAQLKALQWSDVLEALEAHPRIGDRAEGASREAAWSRQEQSAAAGAADDTLRALAAGNAEYEDRFGHVFLICATGKSAGAILAELRDRLEHDPAAEQLAVRAELAAIVRLRLERLAEAAAAAAGAAGAPVSVSVGADA